MLDENRTGGDQGEVHGAGQGRHIEGAVNVAGGGAGASVAHPGVLDQALAVAARPGDGQAESAAVEQAPRMRVSKATANNLLKFRFAVWVCEVSRTMFLLLIIILVAYTRRSFCRLDGRGAQHWNGEPENDVIRDRAKTPPALGESPLQNSRDTMVCALHGSHPPARAIV